MINIDINCSGLFVIIELITPEYVVNIGSDGKLFEIFR